MSHLSELDERRFARDERRRARDERRAAREGRDGRDGAAAGPGEQPPGRKRRRWRKVLLITLLILGLLAGGALVGGGLYLRSVESSIPRVDAFVDVPEETRPRTVVPDAKNLLVLGSDSRDPDNTSGSRTDTIILAHLPKGRGSAQLISIPRDSWVTIPGSRDGRRSTREAKINAAFAFGGVPLMVQTIEQFTGVRIDHVVIIDFAGFKEIVDALGGVDIDVDRTFTSTHSLDKARRFVKGPQHMDGATALDYARERFAFSDGDFTRIQHQQQVIKAILEKGASSGILANPVRLNAFVQATADSVSVDRTLPIFDLAMELRHLRGNNLTFMTSPSRGTGRVGTESVVFVDAAKARSVYDAVRRDVVADIVNAAK